ncbi:hypothetical protein [Mucilaginibacter sp. SG564]|nr:hypothetical protein [Mucilaginibacter sp. SG564]NOW96106.1 hypothetical protein [Mucilaginibacter sp. SG564]
MKKKSYKITFALKEGYSPGGKVYPIAHAGRNSLTKNVLYCRAGIFE